MGKVKILYPGYSSVSRSPFPLHNASRVHFHVMSGFLSILLLIRDISVR